MCLLVQAEASSLVACWDSIQLAALRSTTTAARCWRSMAKQSSDETSANSTQLDLLGELTSSSAGPRAKTSAFPENAPDSTVSGHLSGGNNSASPRSAERRSSGGRTWGGLCPPTTEEILASSCTLWPARGTMRNGSLTKRLRSELRITANGSGCWPTPDAAVMNDGESPESFEARYKKHATKENPTRAGTPLAVAVKMVPWATPDSQLMTDRDKPESFIARGRMTERGGENSRSVPLAMQVKLEAWATPQEADAVHHTPMVNQDCLIKQVLGPWPTPTENGNHNRAGISPKAGDGLATAVQPWPTPKGTDGEKGGPGQVNGRGEVDSLPAAVQVEVISPPPTTWPTPDANDYRSGGPNGEGHTPQLRHLLRGLLNPDWVEALMCWPLKWTFLPPEVFRLLAETRRVRRLSTRGNRRGPSLRLNLLPRD